jgi:hypothetical protein
MATSLIPFNQTPEFLKGSNGEQVIKNLLIQNGWLVIPSYAYTGPGDDKAPRMEGMNTYFIIPDLDICKLGTRRWIEVKTKEKPIFTRITQRFEHGIPLRHYYHYFEVQEASGCPVWLFVYEKQAGAILYASLNVLSYTVRKYTGDKMSRGGMAFFPRDSFTNWDTDNALFTRTDLSPKSPPSTPVFEQVPMFEGI